MPVNKDVLPATNVSHGCVKPKLFTLVSSAKSASSFSCVLLLLASAPELAFAAETITPTESAYPSIFATLRSYDLNKPDVQKKAWVQISSHGMRVSDTDGDSVFLQNFSTDQAWLVSHSRKVYHALHVVEETTEAEPLDAQMASLDSQPIEELTPAEKQDNTHSHPETTTILHAEPCAYMHGQFEGSGVWRGNNVEVWRCLDAQGTYLLSQFYSTHWQVVVREQTPDRLVKEMINVTARSYPKNNFFPNAKYNDVQFDEFVFGTPVLERYEVSGGNVN